MVAGRVGRGRLEWWQVAFIEKGKAGREKNIWQLQVYRNMVGKEGDRRRESGKRIHGRVAHIVCR